MADVSTPSRLTFVEMFKQGIFSFDCFHRALVLCLHKKNPPPD
ncbi:hypothetical protein OIU76_020750, partial [Salix suchowensis]